jgi:predicted outer membrane repeat protein
VIWVAEGTYTPTAGTDRSATFQLQDSLALYGGFAGGETTLGDRDWVANVTILSGDIGVVGDSADNSYHVVTGTGTNWTAVLDGFTVTGGNANGTSPYHNGGGMYNSTSGAPTVAHVTFLGNAAAFAGGGMAGAFVNLTNIRFEDNSAGTYGGGLYISGVANVANVVFEGNTAGRGGAICNFYISAALLKHINIVGNSATWFGGAIYNRGNIHPSIANSIVWGNTAPTSPQIHNESGATPVISYSLIEGCGGSGGGWVASLGTDGGGNIDADPRFVDASSADLHLWSSSPAIEAGDNSAVPPGVTTDLDGNPRIYGTNVDMGAYEYQGLPTGIVEDPEDALPKTTALRSVYPNPFNPTLTVVFDLDRRRAVQMTIYHVAGRRVRQLVDEVRGPGTHKVLWDGRDDVGNSVATGVYFLQVRSEEWRVHRKIVLLK